MAAIHKGRLRYHALPKRVSRKEFNRYVAPHLSRPRKGPKPKLSPYRIFNAILHVLHTGMQWDQLRVRNPSVHWTNICKWHNRWSKDGSYQHLFLASVMALDEAGKLDLSVLHGDGSNTVAKKGAKASATPAGSTRRVKRR